jgi:hypothetical protein
MPVFKMQFFLVLIAVFFRVTAQAQALDTVVVTGQVRWKDTGITGYPNELKAISGTNQVY